VIDWMKSDVIFSTTLDGYTPSLNSTLLSSSASFETFIGNPLHDVAWLLPSFMKVTGMKEATHGRSFTDRRLCSFATAGVRHLRIWVPSLVDRASTELPFDGFDAVLPPHDNIEKVTFDIFEFCLFRFVHNQRVCI
jgi:hypothetical protein